MKKYMIVFALCAHTLYGCSAGVLSDSTLSSNVYRFTGNVVEGDGIGDTKHIERALETLPEDLPFSSRELIEGGTISDDSTGHRRTFVDRPPTVGIAYCPRTALFNNLPKEPQVILTEHLITTKPTGLASNFSTRLVVLPLGVIGYMKPQLPIDHGESKESLFGRLDSTWQNLITNDRTYLIENILLVLAYYSPLRKFPANALKALAESPYAAGKRVVYLAKGKEEVIGELEGAVATLSHSNGSSATVVSTKDFIPEADWHILQQIAWASVGTGDSSSTDPIFYGHLGLGFAYGKNIELQKWLAIAMFRTGDEDVSDKLVDTHQRDAIGPSDPRVVQYLRELMRKESGTFIDFIRTIDNAFMAEWKDFCAYMEKHYTLTPQKMATILEIGTKMVLAEDGRTDLEPYRAILNKRIMNWLEALNDVWQHPGSSYWTRLVTEDDKW